MATVLTSSTRTFGGIAFPTEEAFKWCFALGAAAAFAGVGIAAFVPRRGSVSPDPAAPAEVATTTGH
jgi:hypothetical protein